LSVSSRLAGSDRAALLCVVLAALVLLVPGLGARDLWDPDEPRTALVTRDLAAGSAWAAPTLDGRPWLEKPPLYYWLAAEASRAGGRVDALSVRLPANLAAVLLAVTVFLFGRALWGRRAGLLAALVLVTTEDILIEARWARPDMLLGLLLTIAALAAWKAAAEDDARWTAAFWGALGLAILAKGPVALLPLAGVALYAMAARDAGFLGRLRPAWGIPLMLMPAGVWMAAWSTETGSGFPLGAILGRFATRVGVGVHHAHPPSEVLTMLPLALLPWVAVLPAAIAETWPDPARGRDRRSIFLYALLLADLTLFTLSAEKRGVYLLPMTPLIALLIGRFWDARLYAWDPPPPARLLVAGFGGWLVVVIAAAVITVRRLQSSEPALLQAALWLAAAGLLGAMAPLLFFRRAGAGRAIGIFAGGAALAAIIVTQVVLPAIDPYKSARRFGQEVGAIAGVGPIGILGDPHAGISWYSGRGLTLLPGAADLARFLAEGSDPHVVVEALAWEGMTRSGAAPGAVIAAEGRVGHRRFVLLARRSP
jgi:4-amino-4-deoxy-L-arabinose transferase-like glycosyltransferase